MTRYQQHKARGKGREEIIHKSFISMQHNFLQILLFQKMYKKWYVIYSVFIIIIFIYFIL